MENIVIFLSVIGFSVILGAIAVWRRIPIMMFIMGAVITFFALQSDEIIQGYYDPLVTIHNHTTNIPTSTTRYQMGHSFSDSNDGNSLIGQNSPVFTDWTDPDPVFENLGQYVEFNGSTQYARAVGNTQLDVTTQDFSFMGLLFRDTDTGGTERIIAKITATDGYSIHINSVDQLQFDIRDASTTISLATPTTILPDEWYVWGVSADRSNIAQVYLFRISTETLTTNGVDISTLSASLSNTALFHMARNPLSGIDFCDCWMDEVRYYDGKVLSGQEFHDIIHAGFPDSDITEIHEHKSAPEPIVETLPIWTRIIIMLTGSMFMITGALIWKSKEETEPQ